MPPSPLIRGLLVASTLLGAALAQAAPADDKRHLLNRAGLGVAQADWQAIEGLSYKKAVDRLIDDVAGGAVTPPPAWTDDQPLARWPGQLSQEEREALAKQRRRQGRELKQWWMQEILATPAPLRERMTLFWHNHFTSSLRKTRSPYLMYRQNQLYRQHAVGNFGALLHAVVRDPAMLIYLDNIRNQRRGPNENFARELLELFTLGEGHYTENDVKAAAHALTGWGVDRGTLEFRFYKKRHDRRRVTFLGKRGRYDGDDVVERLLAHPATARFVVSKLWREFISVTPNSQVVELWAAELRKDDYELAPLLRTMLTSAHFLAADNRAALVRSPVELAAALLRQRSAAEMANEAGDKIALRAMGACRRMGQDLFDPPNVKGWAGGTAWIDTHTLALREQLSRWIINGLIADEARANPLTGPLDGAATEPLAAIEWRLLAAAPYTAPPTRRPLRYARLLATDPMIHLK